MKTAETVIAAVIIIAWIVGGVTYLFGLANKSHVASLPETDDDDTEDPGQESFCHRHGVFYKGDGCPFCKGPDNG